MKLDDEKLEGLRRRVESEWRDRIAPFWLKHAPDEEHGGFRGWLGNDLRADVRADKGIILNSRILWAFSRAYALHGEPAYRQMARRAYAYLAEHFTDREHGGVYWTLDYRGRPADTRKKTYAQAFALYGLCEFYAATGEGSALDEAFEIFRLLEGAARDRERDGYFETFERDWTLAREQRLSEVDQDEKKSMNTHLHVVEAYAALLGASRDARVKERLRALLDIFLAHIIHPREFYLRMFFDETWACRSARRSFGHDIEASWLLCEAADALGDAEASRRVRSVAVRMAESVYANGLDADGGLLYEAGADGAVVDGDKHWWVQAEAVVGFLNAHALGGGEHFLGAAVRVWEFVERNILDRENGEWFWKVSRGGAVSLELPKLSQWKCPYHNGRMCFEVSRRLREIREDASHGARGV